jgi:hypothetical protein
VFPVDLVPVEIVIETQAQSQAPACADIEAARAVLTETLALIRVPRRTVQPRGVEATFAPWVVRVSLARGASPASTLVQCRIVDDAGVVVAERALSDHTDKACLPLARAAGAWASLVLDAELNRASDAVPSAPVAIQLATIPAGSSSPLHAVTPDRDAPFPGGASEHRQERGVDVGVTGYLRSGMSALSVAGVSPFVTLALSDAWLLRPALHLGRSTDRGEGGALATHLGSRLDLCRRLPGNYPDRKGLEADLCAGVEGGVLLDAPHEDQGRLGVGPAVNLRGELGGRWALELRGLLGVNVLPYADHVPQLVAAGEVGISMRLP